MRGSLGMLVATATLLFACANGGVGVDDGQPGTVSAGDGGGGQASRGEDSGGGSSSSSGSSGGGVADSGPGDDGSASDDASSSSSGGSLDSGSSSSGGSDASTGSTFCGANPAYYLEALSAYTGGGATLCLNSSGCAAGDCCFQAVQQLPVNVCIKQ